MLIIARHAESGFNGQNRIQGHMDSKLTRRGSDQARILSRRLAAMKITRIYSSDLGRAVATTREIARRLRMPIIRDARLREIRLGRWEGLTPEEVNARFRNGYDQWRRAPSRMRIPGGETVLAFHARVRGAVERIARAEKRGTVLIVTHGGVIASLIAHWMRADFDRVLLNLKLDNTGLTFVELRRALRRSGGERVILHALNDVSHCGHKKSNELTVFTQSA